MSANPVSKSSPAAPPRVPSPDWRWVARMAWRDSRGQRRLLLLFMLGVVAGIAALTAVTSFRHNLESAVENQARSLLGADLELDSQAPFSPAVESFITELGGEQARETRLVSMAYFPEQKQSRLVQVRGLEGAFPFYGEMVTEPANLNPQQSAEPIAVVEETLLRQYGAKRGDTLKLGTQTFQIAGSFIKVGGESTVTGLFAPRIFISLKQLDTTGLLSKGSLVRYAVYFKYEGGLDEARATKLATAQKGLLADERVDADTVNEQKEKLGNALRNLTTFLQLTGFIALLLGGLGVSGAIQVYLKQKLVAVAILRCLGSPLKQAFSVYLMQVMILGLLGAVIGAALGVAVQMILPRVLAPFLPLDIELFISWRGVAMGLLFGWLTTALFSLIPLLEVRKTTALRALRISGEGTESPRRDPWFWVVVGIMAVVLVGFCFAQTSKPLIALGFAGGLAAALLVLTAIAALLRWSLRKFTRERGAFVWRQGLANLYRPNNRTLFLLVTLGMGVLLIDTLYQSRALLLNQYKQSDTAGQPNLILFDIQPDQLEGVSTTVRSMGFPVVESAPIVTMRIEKIKGRTLEVVKNDKEVKTQKWALNREYRSTFRGSLNASETIISGKFDATWNGSEPVPISIEEGIAKNFEVGLNDTLTWDVQGVPMETRVTSIRKVDWKRVRTNFFVVFPQGVLEDAPAIYALVTRTGTREETARLQVKLAETYPNVSAIDLSLVLDTLGTVLDKAAFVVQFMATFTLATGLLVLMAALYTSRYQRTQEAAILRALGASGGTVMRIMAVEYALLGILGGLCGALLSAAATWSLATWVFEASFTYNYGSALAIVGSVLTATLSAGWWHSRGMTRHPPLQVLRDEVR